jgi:hypothetical protein
MAFLLCYCLGTVNSMARYSLLHVGIARTFLSPEIGTQRGTLVAINTRFIGFLSGF